MKTVWLVVIISQIVVCDDTNSIYKDWTNIRRGIELFVDRSCLTWRGKRGICLPAAVCGKHVSNVSSNNILAPHCKRKGGIPTVCCHVTRKLIYSRSIRSSDPNFLPISPPTYVNASNNLQSLANALSPPAIFRFESNSTALNNTRYLNVSIESIRRKRSLESVTSSNAFISSDPESVRNMSENSVNNQSTPSLSSSVTSSTSNSSNSNISRPMLLETDFINAFPEPPICGVSNGSFSRVVGGNNANLGDFPWIGLIAYRTSGGVYFKCGASLITSQHSLTAAHCIVGFEDSLYFVRMGELDLDDQNQSQPVDALVKTMIPHETYNSTEHTSDIGLLVFHRRLLFTDFIKPICLPLSEELRSNNFDNYNPFVAGWGRASYRGPYAARLQMLQLPVVDLKRCREAYAPLSFLVIDERVICAGGQVGKDACNGDSGGPLMQPIWNPKNHTTYFYQTGIVSLGVKCGTLGFPGVYTRVTAFIPWIQKHILDASLNTTVNA